MALKGDSSEEMARRVAAGLQEDWVVNVGIGMRDATIRGAYQVAENGDLASGVRRAPNGLRHCGKICCSI